MSSKRHEYYAAYYKAHKDERKAYYEAHKNERREERLEKQAVYRKANKEKMRMRQKKYGVAHKEERRAYWAALYQANKAAVSVRQKEYYKAHRVEFRARATLYRALKAGAITGNLNEIEEIYRKAKEDTKVRCYLCGKLIPKGHRHVDHIIPLSKGGAHRPSNLAASCDKCNMEKHDKLPEEVGVLL